MHDIISMDIAESVFAGNRKIAEYNSIILKKFNIRAFDFLGAVGSGKTILIEKMGKLMGRERKKTTKKELEEEIIE